MNGRTQKATFWKRDGYDKFGQPAFNTPISFMCRWQGVAKLFHNAEGAEFVSEAVVYPQAIAIRNGDFIALGKNADLKDAKEVRFSGFSPSSESAYTVYKVAL